MIIKLYRIYQPESAKFKSFSHVTATDWRIGVVEETGTG